MNGCEIAAEYASEFRVFGSETDAVTVRLSVEPHALEELLDALAHLDFPVDPRIIHRTDLVCVEFHSTLCHASQVEEAFGALGKKRSLAFAAM